jgi:hypothetical protein
MSLCVPLPWFTSVVYERLRVHRVQRRLYVLYVLASCHTRRYVWVVH